MASSSTLDSKYYNKLLVNKLQANKIKADDINTGVSYLYSINFPDVTLKETDIYNEYELEYINSVNDLSLIEFTDRPIRYSKEYFGSEATMTLMILFYKDSSFSEDPPNVVLTHNNQQSTYELLKVTSNNMLLRNIGEVPKIDPFENSASFMFIDNGNNVNRIYINNESELTSNTTITIKNGIKVYTFQNKSNNNVYILNGNMMDDNLKNILNYSGIVNKTNLIIENLVLTECNILNSINLILINTTVLNITSYNILNIIETTVLGNLYNIALVQITFCNIQTLLNAGTIEIKSNESNNKYNIIHYIYNSNIYIYDNVGDGDTNTFSNPIDIFFKPDQNIYNNFKRYIIPNIKIYTNTKLITSYIFNNGGINYDTFNSTELGDIILINNNKYNTSKNKYDANCIINAPISVNFIISSMNINNLYYVDNYTTSGKLSQDIITYIQTNLIDSSTISHPTPNPNKTLFIINRQVKIFVNNNIIINFDYNEITDIVKHYPNYFFNFIKNN